MIKHQATTVCALLYASQGVNQAGDLTVPSIDAKYSSHLTSPHLVERSVNDFLLTKLLYLKVADNA